MPFKQSVSRKFLIPTLYISPALLLGLALLPRPSISAGVPSKQNAADQMHAPMDGPADYKAPLPLQKGDAAAGQTVFRYETFGDEGFWTDAARMPQGVKQAKVTPVAALKLGLSVDVERIPASLAPALAKEVKTDLSLRNAPLLNSPATLDKLIKANAVIGIVSTNGKVGIACALCHTVTDASLYGPKDGNGGGIGHRLDGLTQHYLNVGKLLATCANSRAFYPSLQLAHGGKSIGRAPSGLTMHSTEAQVDAYLSNPKYYPIGTFDDTPDGNGNAIHVTPLFRQDLAAPYGTSGQNAKLEDFNNTVYTALFDESTLATPPGRAFLTALGGLNGEKTSREYAQILKETGVTNYPYVQATRGGKPGSQATPVGLRVNEKKLLDLNAYLASLPAPKGAGGDTAAIDRGKAAFQANCTSCHNVDQSKPVSAVLIPMTRIWPGYKPQLIVPRTAPLDPIQNAPGTFDDKMVVVDASPTGGIRGQRSAIAARSEPQARLPAR